MRLREGRAGRFSGHGSFAGETREEWLEAGRVRGVKVSQEQSGTNGKDGVMESWMDDAEMVVCSRHDEPEELG